MRKPILTLTIIAYSLCAMSQNVGIGTNTPGTKLDVNGAITVRETSVAVSNNAATIPANVSQIQLTGAATATITLSAATPPNAGQLMNIYNNTTGGYAAMFNSLTIPNGQAVEFIYSNAAWRGVSSAVTVAGATGATGSNGSAGPTGPTGPAGAAGAVGATGAAGTAGAAGATGPTGAAGAAGTAGAAGATGSTGAGYYGTSSSSNTIASSGSFTFATQTGLAYVVGDRVRVVSQSTATNYMEGTITAYSAGSMTISVTNSSGSGAVSSWYITATGNVGATGAAGAAGVAGATGPTGSAGAAGIAGATGPTGLLSAGSAAGNTPYWNGSSWVVNSGNIYNNGGNVGIGTTSPGNTLSVVSASNPLYLGGLQSGATTDSVLSVLNGVVRKVAAGGSSTNIYTADGTLGGNRTVTMGTNSLTLNSTTGNFIFNPSSTGGMAIGTTSTSSNILNVSPAAAASGNGNGINLSAQAGGNNGSGGSVNINGGAGGVSGSNFPMGGSVNILAGAGGTSGTYGTTGGNITLAAGSSSYCASCGLSAGSVSIYSGGAISGSTLTAGNINLYTGGYGTGTTPSQRMIIVGSSGYVGIGTTSPKAPLDVEVTASGNISGSPRQYFEPSYPYSGGGTGETYIYADQGNSSGAVSMYASGWIMSASGFMAASDARIKDIQGPTDNIEDLETLNKIKITNYKYKDVVANGNRPNKKVIAQQVQEVYPQAVTVNTYTKLIPNIYEKTSQFCISGGIITASLRTNVTGNKDIKVGSRCKLYASSAEEPGSPKEINGTIAAISDSDISIVSPDVDDAKYNELFVYGTEISDFMSVDYEAISMLNVSATQELARLVKEQQKRIQRLEDQNGQLKAENANIRVENLQLKTNDYTNTELMKSMQAQIDVITQRLNMSSENTK